jgi:4-hydroxythreonine-4-phosphate dehydrogenase
LAREFGGGKSLMIMATEVLRVALVTDHIPLKDVPRALTAQRIREKIELFASSLAKDFGALQPKIAVLGLNPHAGENGTMGREEMDIITPLLAEMREKYPTLLGPFSADAFFGRHDYRKFDGVLALYHDQGLIPFKALAGSDGVNFTAGLPLVRTSPAHGTAFDIAGKNKADESSTLAAFWCAIDVLWRRENAPKPNPKPERIPKPL